jgi:hypothetical protein
MSIRKRGNRAYQVGVSPFPAQTVPTREAAERLELNLKLRRRVVRLLPSGRTTLGIESTASSIEHVPRAAYGRGAWSSISKRRRSGLLCAA